MRALVAVVWLPWAVAMAQVMAEMIMVARPIMMALARDDIDDALTHLDAAHASLAQDRDTLDRLEKVPAAAAAGCPAEATTDPLTIGELARKLGVTPTTLRSWEKAGALTPRRHPAGNREYQPEDVRDAHLVHMLRRGHVPLPHIVTALEQVHSNGSLDEALAQVQGWRARVNQQSRNLLAASARIEAVVVVGVLEHGGLMLPAIQARS